MHEETVGSKIVKWVLIGVSVLFLVVMLLLPLATVISETLRDGWKTYQAAVTDKYTVKAVLLTLEATAIAVGVNTVFGVFAALAVTKYQFRGKKVLTTLIDVPVTISPIIAGLIFLLTFGRQSVIYPLLHDLGIHVVFAVPGIVLATIFVTFPFVSRELIPVLESQGTDEEEAAALMGANAWTIFRKVTFPHIKWALLYGVVLCAARAMGEFGAVSVLSGHLRGRTNTLPLHVEILFNEFQYVPAFAAQGSGFNVKADEIEYDMTSGNGTAKGNVVILHDGGKATAAAAEFNSKTMSGKLTGGVVADKDDAHITCATFVMHNEDFVSAVGEASVTKEDKTLTAEQIDYHSDAEYAETIGSWGQLTSTDGSVLTAAQITYNGKTGLAEATGNVDIVSPPRNLTAKADKAIYDTNNDGKVELIGNATATQDGNTVSGNRLIMNNAGNAAAGQRAEAFGNIKIVYVPKNQPAQAEAGTAAAGSEGTQTEAAAQDAAAETTGQVEAA